MKIPGNAANIHTANTLPNLALPPNTKLMVPHRTREMMAAATKIGMGLAAKLPSMPYCVHFIDISRCAGGACAIRSSDLGLRWITFSATCAQPTLNVMAANRT